MNRPIIDAEIVEPDTVIDDIIRTSDWLIYSGEVMIAVEHHPIPKSRDEMVARYAYLQELRVVPVHG